MLKGNLIIPEKYKSPLDMRNTQRAIKVVKDTFQKNLSRELRLERISAPLFVRPETGLNDNLNGIERPVRFDIPDIQCDAEIVQSLAKWKRLALSAYGFAPGEGLYTDMNAIRRDEELDNLHSVYVDQWDWEKVINKSDRSLETLKDHVIRIVKSISDTSFDISRYFPSVHSDIGEDVYFITTSELEQKYPDLTPKERENRICKEKKTVCLMQIGGKLSDGNTHDGRAPDYDDWNLNCDILVWYPILDRAFELSSMGVRVDEETLLSQLAESGNTDRRSLAFHSMLLDGKLPYTIGGGIGQSRLCMFLLGKAHIGEVQASIWPEKMITDCKENGIFLL